MYIGGCEVLSGSQAEPYKESDRVMFTLCGSRGAKTRQTVREATAKPFKYVESKMGQGSKRKDSNLPLAKPPRPSASSHSASGEGRTFVDMLFLASSFKARVKRHPTIDKERDTMNIVGIVAGKPCR